MNELEQLLIKVAHQKGTLRGFLDAILILKKKHDDYYFIHENVIHRIEDQLKEMDEEENENEVG